MKGGEEEGMEAVLRKVAGLIRQVVGEGGGEDGKRDGGAKGVSGPEVFPSLSTQSTPPRPKDAGEPGALEEARQAQAGEGTCSAPSSPSPPLHLVPLLALGLDSLTLAHLKARIEEECLGRREGGGEGPGEGGQADGFLPEEYFYREETTGGHVAAMVWAIQGGREEGRGGGGRGGAPRKRGSCTRKRARRMAGRRGGGRPWSWR
ncbi:hypothetical protein Naga_101391g1 [Nannochloropsis gaditana]|uniref:Uncharacterized protein n=1 Tax=Nannochloropsis gaditana TaxID=72520 RepID=W7THF0_9STRA|nr:hypothetical protein Naga_101391g1 [Nannochloropsis gaditana]